MAPSARSHQVVRPIAGQENYRAAPDSRLACLGTTWVVFRNYGASRLEHRASGGDVLQMVHDLIPVFESAVRARQDGDPFPPLAG